jgi:hypothetical protein
MLLLAEPENIYDKLNTMPSPVWQRLPWLMDRHREAERGYSRSLLKAQRGPCVNMVLSRAGYIITLHMIVVTAEKRHEGLSTFFKSENGSLDTRTLIGFIRRDLHDINERLTPQQSLGLINFLADYDGI